MCSNYDWLALIARDRALERLWLQQTQRIKGSLDQPLTSSSDTLALHLTLLEQHMDLRVRHQECASAVVHVQTQLSKCRSKFQANHR